MYIYIYNLFPSGLARLQHTTQFFSGKVAHQLHCIPAIQLTIQLALGVSKVEQYGGILSEAPLAD